MVDLDMGLDDVTIEMFETLVGSLFTRARRGRERRYQATTRDIG